MAPLLPLLLLLLAPPGLAFQPISPSPTLSHHVSSPLAAPAPRRAPALLLAKPDDSPGSSPGSWSSSLSISSKLSSASSFALDVVTSAFARLALITYVCYNVPFLNAFFARFLQSAQTALQTETARSLSLFLARQLISTGVPAFAVTAAALLVLSAVKDSSPDRKPPGKAPSALDTYQAFFDEEEPAGGTPLLQRLLKKKQGPGSPGPQE